MSLQLPKKTFPGHPKQQLLKNDFFRSGSASGGNQTIKKLMVQCSNKLQRYRDFDHKFHEGADEDKNFTGFPVDLSEICQPDGENIAETNHHLGRASPDYCLNENDIKIESQTLLSSKRKRRLPFKIREDSLNPEDCNSLTKRPTKKKKFKEELSNPSLSKSPGEDTLCKLSSVDEIPCAIKSEKKVTKKYDTCDDETYPNSHSNRDARSAIIRIDNWKDYNNGKTAWERSGRCLITCDEPPGAPGLSCFLCGCSSVPGDSICNSLIFCSCCCEPFHIYCVEERKDESLLGSSPLLKNQSSWICQRCKYCYVCGRPNNLIECSKCKKTYHESCLGRSYPTKPSGSDWICMQCVRCISCGAIKPGNLPSSKWTHNYTMCQRCGDLYDKGNFCPICKRCYTDEDYDTKMVQCAGCEQWVHSQCENMSHEMYMVLSNSPDNVQYHCPPCGHYDLKSNSQSSQNGLLRNTSSRYVNKKKSQPIRSWKKYIQNEIQAGLESIIMSLFHSPVAYSVLRQDFKSEQGSDNNQPSDLFAVRFAVHNRQYNSLSQFHTDTCSVLDKIPVDIKDKVYQVYYKEASKVFSWFDFETGKIKDENENSDCLPNATAPPSSEHDYAQWRYPEGCTSKSAVATYNTDVAENFLSDITILDQRKCMFCQVKGDLRAEKSGRLLYCGQDDWAHVNCALWSAEVFELGDGSLQNVKAASSRGRMLKCDRCKLPGATVGCNVKDCYKSYHFACARASKCVFLYNKQMFCPRHSFYADKTEILGNEDFAVDRFVYMNTSHLKPNRSWQKGKHASDLTITIGSLTVNNIGHLTISSDSKQYLTPVNYRISRMFWSTFHPYQKTVYNITVSEVRLSPDFNPATSCSIFDETNKTICHSPGKLMSSSSHKVPSVSNQSIVDNDQTGTVNFNRPMRPSASPLPKRRKLSESSPTKSSGSYTIMSSLNTSLPKAITPIPSPLNVCSRTSPPSTVPALANHQLHNKQMTPIPAISTREVSVSKNSSISPQCSSSLDNPFLIRPKVPISQSSKPVSVFNVSSSLDQTKSNGMSKPTSNEIGLLKNKRALVSPRSEDKQRSLVATSDSSESLQRPLPKVEDNIFNNVFLPDELAEVSPTSGKRLLKRNHNAHCNAKEAVDKEASTTHKASMKSITKQLSFSEANMCSGKDQKAFNDISNTTNGRNKSSSFSFKVKSQKSTTSRVKAEASTPPNKTAKEKSKEDVLEGLIAYYSTKNNLNPEEKDLVRSIIRAQMNENDVKIAGNANLNKNLKKKKNTSSSPGSSIRRGKYSSPKAINKQFTNCRTSPIFRNETNRTIPSGNFETSPLLTLYYNRHDVLKGKKLTDYNLFLSDSLHTRKRSLPRDTTVVTSNVDNSRKSYLSYEIRSDDGYYAQGSDIHQIIDDLLASVQECRGSVTGGINPTVSLHSIYSAGSFLGLSNDSIRFLVEQLPGARYCPRYKSKFNRLKKNKDGIITTNIHGCARAEKFNGRSEPDMFSFLISKHRSPPKQLVNPSLFNASQSLLKRGLHMGSDELPLAMRFRHLRSSSKDSVGVYRSTIHGRGLFCKRDHESGEMIMEYTGQVIRNNLTDIREKYYESKGIGCYMFRLDNLYVVDATLMGNGARFINHSCEPNCYSRIVQIGGVKHIVIFALRKILCGEELTYDYKFPIEEDKIACYCGSKSCRKYMN